MISPPTLETSRLRIRPYRDADIAELLPLIGTREVAATTLRIAHPYTEQDAREFFQLAKEPDKLWLAITLRADGRQIGGIGMRIEPQHRHAELGYWLGAAYWGQGYATEAAREMLRYGFEELGLHHLCDAFQAQRRVRKDSQKDWYALRRLPARALAEMGRVRRFGDVRYFATGMGDARVKCQMQWQCRSQFI
jgi:hypothetical protein